MRRLAIAIPAGLVLLIGLWLVVGPDTEHTARTGATDDVVSTAVSARPEGDGRLSANATADGPRAARGSIVVMDASTRAPIEGALLVVSDSFLAQENGLRLRTDPRGNCMVSEDAGEYVAVYAHGYKVRREYASFARARGVLLVRAKPRKVIVADIFGKRLPDAFAEPEGAPELRVHADEQGRIAIARAQQWKVDAPGYNPEIVEGTKRRCVLHEAYSIAGLVVDSSGDPVAGAPVELRQQQLVKPDQRSVTDEAGRFAFAELIPGSLHLSIDDPRYVPTSVQGLAGTQDISIVLYRAASVQCNVVGPDGQPAHGSKVSARIRAEDGPEALFTRLPPGRRTFRANLGDAQCETTVTLNEGEHRVLRLVLKRAKVRSQVCVQVIDPDGRPIARASVSANGWLESLTDANGHARFELATEPGTDTRLVVDVPPDLELVAAQKMLLVRSVALAHAAQPVTLRLARLVPFELELVDTDGDPVPNHFVNMITDHVVTIGPLAWLVPEGVLVSANVAAKGERFALTRWLKGLKPGRHRIVMFPPSAVVGRAVDSSGRPVPVRDMEAETTSRGGYLMAAAGPPASGRFRITGLEGPDDSDRRVIHLIRGGFREASMTVAVQHGRDFDVGDVVLLPRVRWRGRVRDRTGAPLAGAHVRLHPLPGMFSRGHSSRADGTFDMLESGLVTHFLIAKPGHGARLVPAAEIRDVRLPEPGAIETVGHESRLGWRQDDGSILWPEWDPPSRYDVAPGQYVVETEDKNAKTERHDITVAAGETVRVLGG